MGFIKVIFVILLFCIIYFYRYPFWIGTPMDYSDNNKVFSPAFGTIMNIKKEDNGDYFIAIFLSPLDIHYQFSPVSGSITDIKYDPTGKFELAYDLNKSRDNEKSIFTIENSYGKFKVYQIAGKLVRRISRFRKIGDDVKTGQVLGLIHFGSRVDIIIPNRDNRFTPLVRVDEKVNANTPLGYFKSIDKQKS